MGDQKPEETPHGPLKKPKPAMNKRGLVILLTHFFLLPSDGHSIAPSNTLPRDTFQTHPAKADKTALHVFGDIARSSTT